MSDPSNRRNTRRRLFDSINQETTDNTQNTNDSSQRRRLNNDNYTLTEDNMADTENEDFAIEFNRRNRDITPEQGIYDNVSEFTNEDDDNSIDNRSVDEMYTDIPVSSYFRTPQSFNSNRRITNSERSNVSNRSVDNSSSRRVPNSERSNISNISNNSELSNMSSNQSRYSDSSGFSETTNTTDRSTDRYSTPHRNRTTARRLNFNTSEDEETTEDIRRRTVTRLTRYRTLVNNFIRNGDMNQELDISGMGLIMIPDEPRLPSNLLKLNCSNNDLDELDIPSSIQVLNCSKNRRLEILPRNINPLKLNCSHCNISSVPRYYNALQKLDCSHNIITDLNGNYSRLTQLKCSDNRIENLPETLTNLSYLDCSKNHLNGLPNNLTNLKTLICSKNHIDILPENLPRNMDYLDIDYNNLDCFEMISKFQPRSHKECHTNTLQRTLASNNVEQKEQKEESLYSQDMINSIKNLCNTESYITLMELEINPGLIFMITLNENDDNFTVQCYEMGELDKTWALNSNDVQVCEWVPNDPNQPGFGRRILSKPVYKIPFSGSFINHRSRLLLNFYSCFVLKKSYTTYIGSQFGVSNLHGALEDIYTLQPIHLQSFLSKNKTTMKRDMKEFYLPEQIDINPLLLKKPTFVNVSTDTYSYLGESLNKTLHGNGILFDFVKKKRMEGTFDNGYFIEGTINLENGDYNIGKMNSDRDFVGIYYSNDN